jgi:predicted Zn-dependent peptidase
LIAGGHSSLEDMLWEINAITEQRVWRLAQDLFAPGTMAITGLGPLSGRQMKALS